MNRPERELLIGLNLIRELTPRRMTLLLDHFASVRDIWKASKRTLYSIPGFTAELAATITAKRDDIGLDSELKRARSLAIEIVTLLDAEYPPLLRQIDNPPAVLYVRGNHHIDTTRTLAVVGTRRASRYGTMTATKLSRELAKRGIVIVSGLAVGIDTAAHRAALAAGSTIAVLGSGLPHIYPTINERLSNEISENGGSIVSEYPLDAAPARWTFPQRNRIIAGLSRGVLVVEAPQRSGALITARLALEQGREVFAVPGNITSSASAGPNALIKDGATPVASANDVLSEFPDLVDLGKPSKSRAAVGSLSPQQRRVYELIELEPLHIDDIIVRGNLSPTEAAHILLMLQMEGLIEQAEGRRYMRRP